MNGNACRRWKPPISSLFFPLIDEGRARPTRDRPREAEHEASTMSLNDVAARARADSLEVERVNCFSTYHVHHRVANQFWHRSCVSARDAAHIHGPWVARA